MAEKKYLLVPGSVRSRHDGEIHVLSAQRLAELYCVPMEQCMVWSVDRKREDFPDHLITLRPDQRGNYRLPDDPMKEQATLC